MTATRILNGSTERIQTDALKDGSLALLTGLSTVVVSIQRTSDGYWYDFNDDTFKTSGWTTRQQQMSEVSATYAPGEYYWDFDTSNITNATADDTYMVRIDETGGTAKNVPMLGEIKVDQWPADLFDQHGATQAAIAALNNLSQAQAQAAAQAALTSQGYTSGRAPNLDRLDVAVSTRATQAQILSDATPFAGAFIDASISSRSSHSAADVDSQLSGSHGAGSWVGLAASDILTADISGNTNFATQLGGMLNFVRKVAGNAQRLDTSVSPTQLRIYADGESVGGTEEIAVDVLDDSGGDVSAYPGQPYRRERMA